MLEDSLAKRLLAGWMAIVVRFGFVQTLVILAFFYAAIVGPVAVAMALARQDLLGKRRVLDKGSAWLAADSAAPDLERAKLTS